MSSQYDQDQERWEQDRDNTSPACAACSDAHPAEYIYGMATRTDATDKGLANRNPHEQYIIMRAHARAVEIELAEFYDDARAEFQKHGWTIPMRDGPREMIDTLRSALTRYDEMQTAISGLCETVQGLKDENARV